MMSNRTSGAWPGSGVGTRAGSRIEAVEPDAQLLHSSAVPGIDRLVQFCNQVMYSGVTDSKVRMIAHANPSLDSHRLPCRSPFSEQDVKMGSFARRSSQVDLFGSARSGTLGPTLHRLPHVGDSRGVRPRPGCNPVRQAALSPPDAQCLASPLRRRRPRRCLARWRSSAERCDPWIRRGSQGWSSHTGDTRR